MKNDVFQKINQLVSKLFVFPIINLHLKVIYQQRKYSKKILLLWTNHGSLLDPPLLGHALGRNISFMAKAELFKILQAIIKLWAICKEGIVDKNTIKTACKKLS